MSRIDTAKTKCPCGSELVFAIEKPSYFTPKVSKVACPDCDSRFLMTVEVDKAEKIPNPKNHEELMKLAMKPFVRKFKHRFEIIRLSAEAASRAANPLRQAASLIVEKVSKRDNDPQF